MIGELFNTVNALLEGGDRYVAATKVGWTIDQSYRQYRQQAPALSPLERRRLLNKTHREGAVKLTKLCRNNGAIWVKLGQFLSSRSDLLPLEYTLALQTLQNDARPVSFEQISTVIDATWEKDWCQHFVQFGQQPEAAASIAQVHKATLQGGEEVAVKIQFPDVRKRFRHDAAVFRSLATFSAPLVKHVDVRQVMDQLIRLTMEELNFENEFHNMRRFAELPHPAEIRVPKLYPTLCNDQILVTEWIRGTPLLKYLEQRPERAQHVLTVLAMSYVQQITQFGMYHADPHPGNFIITPDEKIAILDFGAMITLRADEQQHYSRLLLAIMGKVDVVSEDELDLLFRQAGFVAQDQTVFKDVSRQIFRPDIAGDTTDRIAYALERMRLSKVTIPDSFVAMARVMLSVGGLMKRYGVVGGW